MNANVSIQILPQNCRTKDEVIRIVDEVIAYIRSTGLTYYVGPSETSIEGGVLRIDEKIAKHHK